MNLTHMTGNSLVLKATKLLKAKKINYKQVIDLLVRASELDHPEAIYALGTWYLHGEYFKKDEKKGFAYIRRAAELNYADACFDVAVSFEKGIGTRKIFKEAFKYYYRGMLLGDKQCIYEVGRCYYYGIGTDRNKELANIILNIAEDYYHIS